MLNRANPWLPWRTGWDIVLQGVGPHYSPIAFIAPKSIPRKRWWSFADMCREPALHAPGWGWTGRLSAFLLQRPDWKQHPLCSLLSATFYIYFIFVRLVVILPFTMASKHSAEVLSCVPKCTMAMMCLTEKMRELDQTCITVLLAVSSMLLNQQSITE